MLKINPKLPYRNLGHTGLIVSALSFGNASNGDYSHENNKAIIAKCLEMGINFFDTAELYWEGNAETSYGKIFQELGVPREQIVVATKVWVGKDPSLNSMGNTNRKHVRQSVKASLERLQMDYVDLIYPHSFDENSPVEEICRAFNDVIQEGLAFYWGISNWDADRVYEAIKICEKYNLHKPIATQSQYNMFIRDEVEGEYETLFKNYGFGLVNYNTLLGGYLTGKYFQSEGSGRFNIETNTKRNKQFWKGLYLDQVDIAKIDLKLKQLKQFAQKQLQCKLVHLAIAWNMKFKYISSSIIGARNPEQLEDSFKALDIFQKLTPEIQSQINKILDNHPTPKKQIKTFQFMQPVRPYPK